MKILMIAFAVGAFLFISNPVFAAPQPQPVQQLDLGKYMGDWYQISHVPLGVEYNQQVCACSRQRLALNDGQVSVRNTCYANNVTGPLIDIKGSATYADPANSTSTFNVTLEIAPNVTASGTYWVIGIDPAYRYAVVSNQPGLSLYILSRTPVMDADLYNEALSIAVQQKIDLRNLQPTIHKNCVYPN